MSTPALFGTATYSAASSNWLLTPGSAAAEAGALKYALAPGQNGLARTQFNVATSSAGSLALAVGDSSNTVALTYSYSAASNCTARLLLNGSNIYQATGTPLLYNTWHNLNLRIRQNTAYASLGSNALFAASNLPTDLDFGPGTGTFGVSASNTSAAAVRVRGPAYMPVHTTGVPAEFTAGVRANTYINLPLASTAALGIVRLNDSTSSTSTSNAATADALRRVNNAVIATSNTANVAYTIASDATTSACNAYLLAVSASDSASAANTTANAASTVANNAAAAASNTWRVNAQGFLASACNSVQVGDPTSVSVFAARNIQLGYSNNVGSGVSHVTALNGINVYGAGTGQLSTLTGTPNNVALRWTSNASFLQDNPLCMRGLNDRNHALVFNAAADGPRLSGVGGGRLGTLNGYNALQWSSNNCVGIGTAPIDTHQLYVGGPLGVLANNPIELGLLYVKATHAGKIAYKQFSEGLDILGATASDTGQRRLIKMWDDVEVVGGVLATGYIAKTFSTGYGYLAPNGTTGSGPANQTNFYSMIATHRVAAAEFNATCDRRVKHDITDFDDAACMGVAAQLRPRHYRLNGETGFRVGFVAQEVAEALPNAVSLMERDGIPDFHMLDHAQITAVQSGAIRGLLDRVAALELKLADSV